jgi:NADH-quinone oxidoreductase subunit N
MNMKQVEIYIDLITPFHQLQNYSFLEEKLYYWLMTNNHLYGLRPYVETPLLISLLDLSLLFLIITTIFIVYTLFKRGINGIAVVNGLIILLGNILLSFFIDPNKNLFHNDILANSTILGTLVITIIMIISAIIWIGNWKEEFSFPIIISLLFILMAQFLILLSNDLLSMYIGIEILAFSLYLIAGVHRHKLINTESAIKYFIMSAIFSMIFIGGGAILFYITGTTNFFLIQNYIDLHSGNEGRAIINLALMMLAIATLGKIGVTPFHMPFVDLYQALNRKSALLFIILPKIPYLWIMSKILFINGDGKFIIYMLSTFIVINMITGGIMAFAQTNFNRLIAYSVIFNNGFLLAQVLASNYITWINVMTFIIIYFTILMGIFTINGIYEIESIRQLKYLDRWNIGALILGTSIFNLMGIPPLSMFPTKFLIISSLIENGYMTIALFIMGITSITIYYYLRLVKNLFFQEKEKREREIKINNSEISPIMSIILSTLFVLQFVFLIYPKAPFLFTTYFLI